MKAFVLFASCALLASPALAQSGDTLVTGGGDLPVANQAESSVATAPAPNSAGDRRICRRIEVATGSRMNFRRVCRTASEWRQSERER